MDRWRAERNAIYNQIMDVGWSEERQAFVQHSKRMCWMRRCCECRRSASSRPRIRCGSPRWTRWTDELVTDSLVYRYDPGASPDGLRGSEGTFSLCTFMYADSLARSGQLEKARSTFEKMLTYANHLGLYSEEIALTGNRSATSRRPLPTSH